MKNVGLIIALGFLACGFAACQKKDEPVKKVSWTCPGCECSEGAKCGCSPENGCKCKDMTSCDCEPEATKAA